MRRWPSPRRRRSLDLAASALARESRRVGGHSDREDSLNRTTLVVAAVALACGATALTLTTPRSVGADTTEATVAELREESSKLRRQLASERAAHRRTQQATRRQVPQRTEVNRALVIAAATYKVSVEKLRRVATCESTLDPTATNGRYAGLFQFGVPLWRTTPYAKLSRTDPYAASLAAGWAFKRGMHRHWPVCGRR
jgi:hypothetical protein